MALYCTFSISAALLIFTVYNAFVLLKKNQYLNICQSHIIYWVTSLNAIFFRV